MCVRVRVRVRACVCVCVRACVRACVRVGSWEVFVQQAKAYRACQPQVPELDSSVPCGGDDVVLIHFAPAAIEEPIWPLQPAKGPAARLTELVVRVHSTWTMPPSTTPKYHTLVPHPSTTP